MGGFFVAAGYEEQVWVWTLRIVQKYRVWWTNYQEWVYVEPIAIDRV